MKICDSVYTYIHFKPNIIFVFSHFWLSVFLSLLFSLVTFVLEKEHQNGYIFLYETLSKNWLRCLHCLTVAKYFANYKMAKFLVSHKYVCILQKSVLYFVVSIFFWGGGNFPEFVPLLKSESMSSVLDKKLVSPS